MSLTHYNEFFSIDEKFKPVISREAFACEPEIWLNFFPHKSFVEFLRSLLDQMEQNKRSVWLHGAYGTGKTYAALVLQKLLNDSADNVEQWFAKYNNEISSNSVKNSLTKIRQGGVLAVFDTNGDGVGAKEQFLVRIEVAIVKQLLDRNLQVPPRGNLDTILNRIEEEGSNFFATRDVIQDRLSFLNSSYTHFSELKKGLEAVDLRDGLLADSFMVLRERSIYLDVSAESLLQWVDNVLEKNHLSKLVFIWDEFSAFVDKNRSELTTLQDLAQAAQSGKFYFIPVTHMSIDSYMAHGTESAKKVNDRFVFKALDMPNDTAFQLVATAFQVVPDRKTEWEQEQSILWGEINNVIDLHLAKFDNTIPSDSFKKILPIHPMAAFVLKHLASLVGSNQRSLFDYLKNDAKGSEFSEFIKSGGPAISGKQFLTVDHLWSYFVERDDLGQDKNVQEIKAEYGRQSTLQPEEQRVFKAVLLFSLLGRLQNESHDLLQPTIENIKASFQGDGAILGVDTVLKKLQDRGCFHVINGRCEIFRSNINEGELEKRKNDLRSKFNTLILAGNTQEVIASKIRQFHIGDRFEVRANSVDSISTNLPNRERFSEERNQILIQFILAKDESEN